MKKNLLYLLFILLGVFISVCCSEELTNLDPVPNFSEFSNIPDEYLEIGEQHNKGLEYAFQTIKEHYIVSTTQNGENPKLIATRSGGKSKLSKKDLLKIGKQAANSAGCASSIQESISQWI